MKAEELAIRLFAEGCNAAEISAATGMSKRAVVRLKRQPATDAVAQQQEQISAAFRGWQAPASHDQVVSL
ncbi:hypothetical protein XarbCFBP7604_09855 [Xanthomonas arboricola]|uniref:hypothetical protein n=1 Tax=Xanthomonas arboricola TaxID=56448 RepID=UPI000CEEFB6D|nr:hypothetical protein [Xanthomonas arboricola]PPU34142.1 hypothetical protein XarbCFBP7604_09855 [Xanthomonas arboricola]